MLFVLFALSLPVINSLHCSFGTGPVNVAFSGYLYIYCWVVLQSYINPQAHRLFLFCPLCSIRTFSNILVVKFSVYLNRRVFVMNFIIFRNTILVCWPQTHSLRVSVRHMCYWMFHEAFTCTFSPDKNSEEDVSLDIFGRTTVGQIISNLLTSSGPGSSRSYKKSETLQVTSLYHRYVHAIFVKENMTRNNLYSAQVKTRNTHFPRHWTNNRPRWYESHTWGHTNYQKVFSMLTQMPWSWTLNAKWKDHRFFKTGWWRFNTCIYISGSCI